MTRDEIMARFDNTPAQKEVNSRRLENELLMRKVKSNEKRINSLISLVEAEGNKVANQLDKDFPNWRMVLVNEVRNKK